MSDATCASAERRQMRQHGKRDRNGSALALMRDALTLLDRDGPHQAAATLSLAIEQAGGTAQLPDAA